MASTSPRVVSAPTGSDEEQIIAAYVGFWDTRNAILSAETPPDPNDPRWPQFATGERLTTAAEEAQRFRDEDLRLVASPAPANFQRVVVVSINGDQAQVHECFVDDAVTVNRSSGTVLNDDVVTLNTSGTVLRVEGVWKVAATDVVQRWEGVAGCSLAD